MAGEQAGLQAQQAQRVIGMHALARTAALQPVPAVGIEPGWQVNRQHRCRCGMQGIDTGLQGGGRRATGPDAEQRINRQVMGSQCCREGRADGDTCRHGLGVGSARIFRQPKWVGQQGDFHLAPPGLQQRGSLQAVAAIVARTAGDPEALCMGRQGAGEPGGSQAGALHQGMRRQLLHPGLFDLAAAGNPVQGQTPGQGAGMQAGQCNR